MVHPAEPMERSCSSRWRGVVESRNFDGTSCGPTGAGIAVGFISGVDRLPDMFGRRATDSSTPGLRRLADGSRRNRAGAWLPANHS